MGKSSRSAEGGDRGRGGVADGQPSSEGAHSFEVALEKLEGAVARLEEGEMPLEEALVLFESGVKLSRQCANTLEAAERRIEILVADRGAGDAVEAFEADIVDDVDDTDEDEDDED